MNRISPREERSSDEIDLRVVFDKLAYFFRKILSFFKAGFFLVLRRWPLFLLLTLLGIGLGFAYHKSKRPFYRSSITLSPAMIRNEFFEDQVNRLAELIIDGNFEVVAADLKIEPSQASQIKSLAYFNLNETQIEQDSVLTGAPFRVEAEVYDNQFFGGLQQALLRYFEENPYFSRSTQARKQQLRSMIAKLKQDIASIDSVKQSAVSLRGPANGFVYGEPLDPTNLYKESVGLHETQTTLEAQLAQLETVDVVVGFAPILKPTGPKLFRYVAVGALLGFLLAFFLAERNERRLKRNQRAF